MDILHSQQRSLGWGLGAEQQDQLSKLAKTPSLIRLYQLLLFTMPGTPVFTYGDEIGLQAGLVSIETDQISPNVLTTLKLLQNVTFAFLLLFSY